LYMRSRFGRYFRFILLLAVGLLLSFSLPDKAQAAGILPPNNPPSNIAPNPDFLNICSSNGSIDNSTACMDAALAAIDNARSQEGVGPMVLPSNFLSLSPGEQLFVVNNSERVDRGLAPFVGLTGALDNAAYEGAISDTDPSLPAGYSFSAEGSNWAGNVSSMLGVDYEWMYNDGYGSPNTSCTSPGAIGCWGHRDNILTSYDCNPCTMGASAVSGTQYSPSSATIYVGDNSGAVYNYVYTWQQEQSSLTPQPVISAIAPSYGGTSGGNVVSIYGSNLSNSLEVFFGSIGVSSITQVSSNEIQVTAPAQSAGEVNVSVVTPGGLSRQNLGSLYDYGQAPLSVTGINIAAGDNSVSVSFQSDAPNPLPVQNYTVNVYQNSSLVKTVTVPAGSNFTNISGLANFESTYVTVVATNALGSSAPAQSSSVTPWPNLAPQVLLISPASGPYLGGNTVSLYGINLSSANGVDFGSFQSSYNVLSDSQIAAVAPAVTGTSSVNVTVTSPQGTSNALNYNYVDAYPYFPMTPERIVDTRINSGYLYQNNTLGPTKTINVNVAGNFSVPANAVAVAVNVTVTDTTSAGGYLTLWPEGASMPTASSINWAQSQTVANLVTVELGQNGAFSIYNAIGYADVIVDLEGYYAPVSSLSPTGLYAAVSPQRLVDTRSNSGYQGSGSTLGPGATLTFSLSAVSGVPKDAVGVVLNVTATNTTSNGGYFQVYPYGISQIPLTSNVNWSAGQTVANRVIVPVGQNDQISIYNAIGDADAIVDIYGYFLGPSDSTAAGSLFEPINPLRICDTRITSSQNQCSGETLYSQLTLNVGTNGLGSQSITALLGNLTVTDTSAWSYLTAYPAGQSMPATSDINWSAGLTIANLDIINLGSGGQFSIYNFAGYSEVIVDAYGFYVSA
jgi:hypothetical protein